MYRVVVVDDEIWSVIGLKKILQEDSQRFQLVYETTDSLDALEQICLLRPDVVFTDVRMPEMSGIDLMREVKRRGIKTEFVVVSGFAEFTYVQQALQEGAVDYQLKPIERSTAKQTLDKLYERLESKTKSRDLDFYSVLRDKKEDVSDFLQGRFDGPLYKKMQIVLLFWKQSDAIRFPLDAGDNAQSLSLSIGPRKCLYIINADENKTEVLFSRLQEHLDSIETAAITRTRSIDGSFDQLIKEAETTLLDSFVYPEGRIFKFRSAKRGIVNQLEECVNKWYAEDKYQQICTLTEELQKIFVDNDMGIEDVVYFWNRTVLTTGKWEKSADTTLEYLDKYALLDRFSTLEELCSYLNAQWKQKPMKQSGTVNEKFFELLRYIDQNYAQHLSLKELCGEFYINMSYCCELFQKHKNMTFSQYLTEVRIGKACELMQYQHCTVAEACDMVGYKDYFYFNKVFKKKMGCTPAEYRKNPDRGQSL